MSSQSQKRSSRGGYDYKVGKLPKARVLSRKQQEKDNIDYGVYELAKRTLTQQVWDLMAQGYSDIGISQKLNISQGTVQGLVDYIYGTLDISNLSTIDQRVKAALAYLMWQHGFTDKSVL